MWNSQRYERREMPHSLAAVEKMTCLLFVLTQMLTFTGLSWWVWSVFPVQLQWRSWQEKNLLAMWNQSITFFLRMLWILHSLPCLQLAPWRLNGSLLWRMCLLVNVRVCERYSSPVHVDNLVLGMRKTHCSWVDGRVLKHVVLCCVKMPRTCCTLLFCNWPLRTDWISDCLCDL